MNSAFSFIKYTLPLLLALAGVIIYITSAIKAQNLKKNLKTYPRVDATVVDMKIWGKEGQGAWYTPTLEYKVADQTYRQPLKLHDTIPPAVGQRFTIAYNPQEPKKIYRTDGKSHFKKAGLIWIGGGLLLFLYNVIF